MPRYATGRLIGPRAPHLPWSIGGNDAPYPISKYGPSQAL
jgi:hypothetical protein